MRAICAAACLLFLVAPTVPAVAEDYERFSPYEANGWNIYDEGKERCVAGFTVGADTVLSVIGPYYFSSEKLASGSIIHLANNAQYTLPKGDKYGEFPVQLVAGRDRFTVSGFATDIGGALVVDSGSLPTVIELLAALPDNVRLTAMVKDKQIYAIELIGNRAAANLQAVLWDLFADYRARMISDRLAEPDDAYREATEILNAEAPNLPYISVIVDEAQDMGEQAFRLVRAIVPESPTGDRNSLFIVGDAHQRIYARRASMSGCGISVRGRSKRLRLNYRTTQEIRAWAVSVLEGVSVDDLDEGTDTLRGYVSLLHGVAPQLVACASETEELERLAAWVKGLPADQVKLSAIGVLCARRADFDRVQGALQAAGIPSVILNSGADDRSRDGVRISTMHRAKGLEFFAVAIPFLAEDAFPPLGALRTAVDAADRKDIITQHRSLLHVAATRAKKALRISWSGVPTKLVN